MESAEVLIFREGMATLHKPEFVGKKLDCSPICTFHTDRFKRRSVGIDVSLVEIRKKIGK